MMSGYGNGKNFGGGTDQKTAAAYGKIYMIGATSGKQYLGTKDMDIRIQVSGISDSDVGALLDCIKRGK